MDATKWEVTNEFNELKHIVVSSLSCNGTVSFALASPTCRFATYLNCIKKIAKVTEDAQNFLS
jgi:hypothetical protein